MQMTEPAEADETAEVAAETLLYLVELVQAGLVPPPPPPVLQVLNVTFLPSLAVASVLVAAPQAKVPWSALRLAKGVAA
jgi:hypothetical protein